MYPQRILLLHNLYRHAGGEDRVFADEGKLLSEFGHDVIRFTADNRGIGSSSLSVAISAAWNQGVYRSVRSLLAEKRPDLVHVHNAFPLLSPAVYYAGRKAGIPVVQTLHNYRLLCPGAFLSRAGSPCEACIGKSFPWPGIAHKCYRGSHAATAAVAVTNGLHRLAGTWAHAVDAYIALSEFARRKFISGGIPAGKIFVKPNSPYPDPVPSPRTGDYVLYAGRLSDEKGILTLLSAYASHPPAPKLKIAGSGQREPEVRTLTSNCPAVEYLGWQSRERVYELTQKAAVVVLPSLWYEGFPMTAVEALGAGVPLIASRIGSLAEIVDHGRTGLLVAPGDVQALRSALEWVASHPAELARMRREARAEFLAKYTAGQNYRSLMQIYQSVLVGKQSLSRTRAASAARAAGRAD
mgnify:CR=1 FL=1